MKRRDGKGAAPADLLVCFPTKAHLRLMPKPICSPSRPSEPLKPNHHHQHHSQRHTLNYQHHLKKSVRGGGGGGGAGHVSPYLWVKNKQGSDTSEPTSPKVTCAGQIKVRPRPGPCKNWQSVMEEIERIHNDRKEMKKSSWSEALGFKKEIMHFLTCLRSVKFDFRCFGAFPNPDVTSDEEDEEEEEDEEKNVGRNYDEEGSSKAVFSKWFMVLQDDQSCKENDKHFSNVKVNQDEMPCAPPPNALLLMRCRSAPAKSWQEEKEEEKEDENDEEEEDNEEEEEDNEEEEEENEEEKKSEEKVEEKNKKRDSLEVLMRYESEFHKFSCDIAKETWVIGGIKDPLSRSRSWKR